MASRWVAVTVRDCMADSKTLELQSIEELLKGDFRALLLNSSCLPGHANFVMLNSPQLKLNKLRRVKMGLPVAKGHALS